MTRGNPAQPQLGTDTELRLPRPPGVFRRWLAAHPRTVDWTIVGSYLFGCAMMLVVGGAAMFVSDSLGNPPSGSDSVIDQWWSSPLGLPGYFLLTLLAIALVATALVFRRRYPITGVVVVSVLLWLNLGLLAVANAVALVFLLYAVPVYRSVKSGWIAYGIAVGLSFISGILSQVLGPRSGVLAAGDPSASSAWGIAVALLAVLMVGINMGNRKRYVAALIDRAHQLAREREQQAMLAAAAERARIAREMHDIVAHSLSVVVTLSEAASVAIDAQPAAAKQAMDRAAETGRSALTEMRRLLGVLNEEGARDPDAPATLAPQPGAAQLPELIAGYEEAGLRVTVSEVGLPVGDAAHQLAVYRIVQESLPNALRYAGSGSIVTLNLAHGPASTLIEVVDSGPSGVGSPGAPAPLPGSGRGLAGAAQRAAVFGGRLEAGPYGRGWRVIAEVPVDAAQARGITGGEHV